MKFEQVSSEGGRAIYVLVFDPGDEAADGLARFAENARVTSASFTGIGACERVALGYYDWERKAYQRIPIDEQVELLSLVGDIAMTDANERSVHAHLVVGLRDGTTRGGHLLEAHVRPTLEVVVTETPAYLRKTKRLGLPLATIALP